MSFRPRRHLIQRWTRSPASPSAVYRLHMIVETATHAGHLDAVRELIDGRQWITV